MAKIEKSKTCEVRLQGKDINSFVCNVTLEEDKDYEQFAKEAYKQAKASLKRLVLDGYRLSVIDGDVTRSFDLNKFRR